LPGELGNDPHADEVPTKEDAVKHPWQRKVQQPRKVLRDFEDWKRPQKPAKGR